jgi:hypothetical protein
MKPETIEKIQQHYNHAKQKHPYFCDCLDPHGRTMPGHGAAKTLEYVRECNKKSIDKGNIGWHDILCCEIWEVYEALSRNDKEQAVEELYDSIAVLLRTIDVLEGRQALGDPAKKGGAE